MSPTVGSGPVQYTMINALVRAMISRLLHPADWQRLLAANDADDVLRLLAETQYASRVQGVRDANLAEMERALRLALLDAYDRLISALSSTPKVVVETMLRRQEVDNLKAILRAVVGRSSVQEARDLLFPLGRYSQLPVEDLLRATRVADTEEILAGTIYGRILRVPLERFHEEGSLFAVDVALDLAYYRHLWANIMLLGGLDRRLARQMVGVRYDLLNIDWIVRFRLLYHLSPQEIFNYTVPYGYRVTDQVVQHAAAATDLAGIIGELPDIYAAALRGAEAAEAPIAEVEVRLQRYLNRQARSALVGYPFHIGEVIAYLWLREAEVHDLAVIAEGKRIGRPPEAMLRLLWGTTVPEVA